MKSGLIRLNQSGLGFRGVGLLNHIQVVSTLVTPLADVSIEVGDGGTVIGVQPEGQFGPETERGRLDGSRNLISRIIVVLQNKRGLSASRISGEIALDGGALPVLRREESDDRSLVEVGDGYGESLGNCIDSIRSLHRNFISVVGSCILAVRKSETWAKLERQSLFNSRKPDRLHHSANR